MFARAVKRGRLSLHERHGQSTVARPVVAQRLERRDGLAQRPRRRELLDVRRHTLGQRQRLDHRSDDLDALDRVDAEVGLEVGVELEHLARVARALAHDLDQALGDVGRGRRRVPVGRRDRKRRSRRRLLDGRRRDLHRRGRRRHHGSHGRRRGRERRRLERLHRKLDVVVSRAVLDAVSRDVLDAVRGAVLDRCLGAACLAEVGEDDGLLRVEEVLHELEMPVHDVPDPLTGRRSRSCGRRGRLHGRGRFEPGDVPLVRIDRFHGHPIHLCVGRNWLRGGRNVRDSLVCGPGAAAVDEPQRRRGGRAAAGRLEGAERQQLDRAAVEQPLGAESHALRREAREAVQKLRESTAPRLVDGDREVRAPGEDPSDEPGQDAARPDLDEDAGAVVVHRSDLARELDGVDQMLAEDLRDRRRVVGVRRGRRVRVDRDPRRGELRSPQHLRQPPLGGLDEGRVERAGNRQPACPHVALGAPLHGVLDRGTGAGDDRLQRRVHVRDHDVDRGQQPVERLGRRLDRRHRARLLARFLADEPPARLGEQQQVLLAHAAGRRERHELAVAVAGHELRLDAEAT
jgi:hypothetical protein